MKQRIKEIFVLFFISLYERPIDASNTQQSNYRYYPGYERRFMQNAHPNNRQPYEGGLAKHIVKAVAPDQQPNVRDDYYTSPTQQLLPWKKLENFFVTNDEHLDPKINYDETYIMKPRPSGAIHWFEKSHLYQQLAGFCVDSQPDPFTFRAYLCTGITDFGINLFIEAISIKDLLTCFALAQVTGDSLYCLTWYVGRIFFRDYLPDAFREELNYEEGRLTPVL